jgi:hypothetical protein
LVWFGTILQSNLKIKSLDKRIRKINSSHHMSLKVVLVGEGSVSSQQAYINSSQSNLDNNGIVVNFEPNTVIKGVKGNGFAIYDNEKMLVSASGISTKHNWLEVFVTFAKNFKNPDMIDGFYAWGQVVPETGEYLCKDCGYIEEFQAGDVFPVCEVCQAGEPNGACEPAEGYWEKI